MRKILLILTAIATFAHAIERPPHPEKLPESVLSAELAGNITLDYQPAREPHIIYFDVQGEKPILPSKAATTEKS